MGGDVVDWEEGGAGEGGFGVFAGAGDGEGVCAGFPHGGWMWVGFGAGLAWGRVDLRFVVLKAVVVETEEVEECFGRDWLVLLPEVNM